MSASLELAAPRTCIALARSQQPATILDLFAGAGGWEEGLHPLGLSALGIEWGKWACRTAEAAGHARLQADLSALDPSAFSPVWGMIGSPPCQAYSTAGKGLDALDKQLVIACAHELAAGNDARRARLGNAAPPLARHVLEAAMKPGSAA
jgi:DNA (cytosine-5)-methyltransferase 1